MPQKLALVIGNSEYQDAALAKLHAPDADVRALTELLRHPEVGQFDDVLPLVNESEAKTRRAIAGFFARAGPADMLLLYFSGHGVLDDKGRLYLAANDTQRDLPQATAISAAFVTDAMDSSRSRRQVLILDCCHSGAFARGARAAAEDKAITAATFEGLGYGRAVLTATDATQYAWEGEAVIGSAENSVFTHFMIEGLRTGAADTDQDGDITLEELYTYLYGQVVKQTPKQTPRKWSYNQEGEFVIARNPRPLAPPPTPLPADLQQSIDDLRPWVREGAARELERLLFGGAPGLVVAAHAALLKLKEDDSRRVAQAAHEVLARYDAQRQAEAQARQAASQQAEAERASRERADAERKERERADAEAALRRQQAEAEQQARARAESERKERERADAVALLMRQQAETERAARERTEAERKERERADAVAVLMRQQAETERAARERTEAERKERERTDAETALKRQQAEAEHQARERTATERLARAKAEAGRIVSEFPSAMVVLPPAQPPSGPPTTDKHERPTASEFSPGAAQAAGAGLAEQLLNGWWLPILMIGVGWALSRGLAQTLFSPQATSYYFSAMMNWLFGGAAGGFVTGLALGRLEPAWRWKHTGWLSASWAGAWGFGFAAVIALNEIIYSLGSPVSTDTIAVVVIVLAGGIGGYLLGFIWQTVQPALSADWLRLLSIGWAVSWALSYWGWDVSIKGSGAISGLVSGLLGGALTAWVASRVRSLPAPAAPTAIPLPVVGWHRLAVAETIIALGWGLAWAVHQSTYGFIYDRIPNSTNQFMVVFVTWGLAGALGGGITALALPGARWPLVWRAGLAWAASLAAASLLISALWYVTSDIVGDVKDVLPTTIGLTVGGALGGAWLAAIWNAHAHPLGLRKALIVAGGWAIGLALATIWLYMLSGWYENNSLTMRIVYGVLVGLIGGAVTLWAFTVRAARSPT